MALKTGMNVLESIIQASGAEVNSLVKNILAAKLQNLIDNGLLNKVTSAVAMSGYSSEIKTATGDNLETLKNSVEDNINIIDNASQEDMDAGTVTFPTIEINNAPVVTVEDGTVALDENEVFTSDTVVATVAVTDEGDTEFALSDDRFEIDQTTGEISIADDVKFDFETESEITLTVTVSDGVNSVTNDIVITINDINETAPVIGEITPIEYTENVNIPAGTVVATAAATDADTSAEITYSITAGNDDGIFAIDAATGDITVLADTAFDFETAASYTLTIDASDGEKSDTTDLVINIADVDPSYTLAADAETAKDGDTVSFTFTAAEAPELTEVEYTITGVDAADVVGGSLTGTATVKDGVATVSVTLLATAANAGKTVTASIDGMDLTDTVAVSAAETPVETTVTLNDILGADNAYILKDAGDTTPALYTLESNASITGANGMISVSGAANITVNSGDGDDTIAVAGTGNNVVNAGAGKDTILLSQANNVVIIEDGDFAKNSAIYGNENGVNTIVVSGTNDLTTGTLSNVQNLVLQSGANVTINEDQLVSMTSVVANGTNNAKLTINSVTDADDTIDLTYILIGSLSKLTLAEDVSIALSADQINAITTITLTDAATSVIVTDQAGAEALNAKGITPSIDAGDAITLEAATTADIANDAYVSYEVNTTAEESFDQLYLGGKSSEQLADTGGTGTTTATINITDTATVAEASAIKNGVDTVGTAYAVSDTAANIANSLIAEVQTLTITGAVTEGDNVATTILATTVAGGVFADGATVSTVGNYVTTNKATFIADWNAANPTALLADISNNAGVITLTYEVISGNVSTIPAVAAANGITQAVSVVVTEGSDWLNATDISSLTIEGASTVDDIQKIFAANGSLATAITASAAKDDDALTMTTPAYTITDTTAEIVGAIKDTSVLNATSVTLATDETVTVAQAATITTALGDKLTGYNISDDADKLAAATTAVRNGATDIDIGNDTATVIEATKIAGFDNTGTTTYDILDDAAKLFTATAEVLSGATVVGSNDALTLAQAAKLAPYFADNYAWTLEDTGANLTSDAALALYEQFENLTVTVDGELTLAQAVTIEAEAATAGQITTLTPYDIEDTAANFIANVEVTSDDALGNTEGQTTAANNVENIIEAAITEGKNVSATGTFTSAQINDLNTNIDGHNIITSALFDYNISDTATNVSADTNNAAMYATEVTITTAATATEAELLQTLVNNSNTIVDEFTYNVEGTYAELAAVIENTGTFVADDDTGNDALMAATTVTVVDADGNATTTGGSVAQAKDVVALSAARVDAGSSAIAYSISDDTAAFEALDVDDATELALLDGATTVEVVDTAAEIKDFAENNDPDVYAYVDSYAISISSNNTDSNGSSDGDLTDDIAAAGKYYDGATSITINDADLTVADAIADYDTVVADSNGAKLVFADVSGLIATFKSEVPATQTKIDAILTASTQVSVTDTVTVTQALALAAKVDGTLLFEKTVTGTVAELIAASSLFDSFASIATTEDIEASDAATVYQYQQLVDLAQAAKLDVLDATTGEIVNLTEVNADITDTITNVQGASAELLSTLGDDLDDGATAVNEITLKAGSEIAMTIAQAKGLADVDDANLANINDEDGTDATYEIVDTIENIINQIHTENNNGETLGDMLTNASSIIATDNGVVIPEAYLTHLETLVSDTAFDTVNSTYSVSGLAATLAGGTVDKAVKNATAVTVTDKATITQADDILTNNANTTLLSVDSADYTEFVTITDGVAAYNTTLASIDKTSEIEAIITAAGSVVDLEDDELTVAQASAISTLLGEGSTLTYALTDTAANLAAADASILANAVGNVTLIDDTNTAHVNEASNATVAQIVAINAGLTHVDADGKSDVTAVYDITDTAANMAAASQSIYDGVNAMTIDGVATAAEALTIETMAKDQDGGPLNVDVTIRDTAENVLANIDALELDAESAFDVDSGDKIELTTAVTVAQSQRLDNDCPIYTMNSVVNDAKGDTALDATLSDNGCVIEDSYANLIVGAESEIAGARYITVTDSINVSKAKQLADTLVHNENNALVSVADALAITEYNIEDTQAYMIQAFSENNAILGAANSITVTDVGTISVDQVSNANDYFITGTVAEISALPAALLEVGFIVNDTVANIAAADATIMESDYIEASIVTDTAAAISAADLTVTGVAAEVHVTDTVDVAALETMQGLGLNIYSIAGVSDTVEALTAATLDYTAQDGITTVTVTDGSITEDELDALVVKTNDSTASNVVYTLEDEVAHIDLTGADDHIENNAAVVITDAVDVAQATHAYALNNAITMSIVDVKGNLDVLLETDISTDEQAQIDAINAATSVSLTSGQVVSVEIASALVALGDSFDGVYTLSDTAANLAAADATLLTNAVQVELSAGNATVAEATILTELTNFKPLATTGADSVYAAMTIQDTAANIADADATLLDNAKTITFLTGDATDDDVTAAQATALNTLVDNTTVVGLDATDDYHIVDTYANITDAANADGVFDAAEVTVTDAITLAQAQAVNTANDDGTVFYDLSDTRSHLQGATSTEAGLAVNVEVTDDVTATQVGIINDLYDDGTTNNATVTFAKVTGEAAELTAKIVDQATTVAVTDALTVSKLMTDYNGDDTFDGGFLAIAGDKLTGGYTIEDGVDNIVNAALNNDYSAKVVADATDVALTAGDEDMNIAASSVITSLNFSGDYTITDTATEIAAANATVVDGAKTVTTNFEDKVSESFDATVYTSDKNTAGDTITSPITIDLTNNTTEIDEFNDDDVVALTGIDVININKNATATGLTTVGDTIKLPGVGYTQVDGGTSTNLSGDTYALYYGYRTGDGFKEDGDNAEDALLVYSDDGADYAVVLEGVTSIDQLKIVDSNNLLVSIPNLTVADAADEANTATAFSITDTAVAMASTGGNITQNLTNAVAKDSDAIIVVSDAATAAQANTIANATAGVVTADLAADTALSDATVTALGHVATSDVINLASTVTTADATALKAINSLTTTGTMSYANLATITEAAANIGTSAAAVTDALAITGTDATQTTAVTITGAISADDANTIANATGGAVTATIETGAVTDTLGAIKTHVDADDVITFTTDDTTVDASDLVDLNPLVDTSSYATVTGITEAYDTTNLVTEITNAIGLVDGDETIEVTGGAITAANLTSLESLTTGAITATVDTGNDDTDVSVVFGEAGNNITITSFETGATDTIDVDALVTDVAGSDFVAYDATANTSVATGSIINITADSGSDATTVAGMFVKNDGNDSSTGDNMEIDNSGTFIAIVQDNDTANGTNYDAEMYLVTSNSDGSSITAELVGTVQDDSGSEQLVFADFA